MIESSGRAIAVVSVHASPLSELGRGDNGGMNIGVRRLCEGLAERGVPTDVFVRRDDPRLPAERLIAPGSRLVLLDVGPPHPIPKQELQPLLEPFADALLAHAASEGRSYRLVHAHYWLSGPPARRVRERLGIPWVQSFHSLGRMKEAAGLPAELERGRVEEVLAAECDRMVAMSRAEGRALVRLYGANPDRICVAEPGVDLHPADPGAVAELREELDVAGRRVVLFAGRLEPLKGADTLIEAIAEMDRDPHLQDVVCLFIGDDSGDGARSTHGGERRRLERLADRAGILDRIRFLGAVPHERLARYYALADVCVVPSRVETFGLVALEAQAQGTPVVASRVGRPARGGGRRGDRQAGRGRANRATTAPPSPPSSTTRPAGSGWGRPRDAAPRPSPGERMVDLLLSIYGRVSSPEIPAELPCGYETSTGGGGAARLRLNPGARSSPPERGGAGQKSAARRGDVAGAGPHRPLGPVPSLDDRPRRGAPRRLREARWNPGSPPAARSAASSVSRLDQLARVEELRVALRLLRAAPGPEARDRPRSTAPRRGAGGRPGGRPTGSIRRPRRAPRRTRPSARAASGAGGRSPPTTRSKAVRLASGSGCAARQAAARRRPKSVSSMASWAWMPGPAPRPEPASRPTIIQRRSLSMASPGTLSVPSRRCSSRSRSSAIAGSEVGSCPGELDVTARLGGGQLLPRDAGHAGARRRRGWPGRRTGRWPPAPG
jgi:D-inositol-3-phosphate glycosyltransferase